MDCQLQLRFLQRLAASLDHTAQEVGLGRLLELAQLELVALGVERERLEACRQAQRGPATSQGGAGRSVYLGAAAHLSFICI